MYCNRKCVYIRIDKGPGLIYKGGMALIGNWISKHETLVSAVIIAVSIIIGAVIIASS